MTEPSLDISIVVPLFNEAESLPELVDWIHRVCSKHAFRYEIILVNDGSSDESWQVIHQLAQKYNQVKGISFRRNYGKSAALQTGFQAASGEVVITMDADLQDSPDEIPELYYLIKNQRFHLISGWKQKRYDPISKTIPTKLFNWATRKISGIELNDFNCGLKAYNYKVVKAIEVYGEMHRYIPVIAKWNGFTRIGEKIVEHRPRKYGYTKFGLERFVNGFLDLLSLSFVGKFAKRPMHFFGSLGVASFLLGFCILVYLTVLKVGYGEYKMTERPLFYFGLITLIVGVQLFLTGFLAELVSRNGHDRNKYHIEDLIHLEE